jgi:hypothetical protein
MAFTADAHDRLTTRPSREKAGDVGARRQGLILRPVHPAEGSGLDVGKEVEVDPMEQRQSRASGSY